MKKCTVFIDSWQIQSEGDHFKVGESVTWRVEHYGRALECCETAGEMDYYYENNPVKIDGYSSFTGTVAGIDVLFALFVPDPSMGEKSMKRSDAYTKPVREAAIWVKDENDYTFDGYIVYFEDYQIRPERKDEQYPSKMRFMNLKRIDDGFIKLFPDEVIDRIIHESRGMLNKELIRKKFTVDVLRNLVGGDPFYFFDDDSYEKLDMKIEVLTALRKGDSPKDIPHYGDIFELLPDDV